MLNNEGLCAARDHGLRMDPPLLDLAKPLEVPSTQPQCESQGEQSGKPEIALYHRLLGRGGTHPSEFDCYRLTAAVVPRL